MPFITVNDVNLFYEEYGSGPETIIFSHGYLMTHEMFQAQIETLKSQFRCIAYDHRAHGHSKCTENGYDMDNLVADGAALIKALSNNRPCHFIGMSTGGYVGLRLAIYYPKLIKSLTLIDTDAESTPKNKRLQYNILLYILRFLGFKYVAQRAMLMMYGKKFLDDPSRKDQVDKWRKIMTTHSPEGVYKFGKGIFNRKSILNFINKVKIPTAIIVGDQDVATPLDMSQRMALAIPNAELHIIPDAGHSSPLEEPEAVNSVIQEFYRKLDYF